MAEMTKEVVVASCKANGGYAAPALNEQLFLHCKGFISIQHLEPYVNAKVLWLEQNAISELTGLASLQNLVSLFVQNNTIRSLKSLTTPLPNLRVLNISHNYLTSLAGLDTVCPALETLQASHNRISSLQACEALWQLSASLTSVDLSYNKIERYTEVSEDAVVDTVAASEHVVAVDDDIYIVPHETTVAPASNANTVPLHDSESVPAAGKNEEDDPGSVVGCALALHPNGVEPRDPLIVVRFFRRLPLVSVVYMHGNGITHGLRHYRRNMILHLPALTYLDERPVFPEERRVVEAWGRGGGAAEMTERSAIQAEKRAHLNSCVGLLTASMNEHREVRERLTRQWEQRRAAELEEEQQRRSQHNAEREAMISAEVTARAAQEKCEQNDRWDLEDIFAQTHAEELAMETARQRRREHEAAVRQVKEEVTREIAAEEEAAAAALGNKADAQEALQELVMTDDDVLREMENEIQTVLNDIGSFVKRCGKSSMDGRQSITSATPPHTRSTTLNSDNVPYIPDRATVHAEQATHTAIAQLGTRLRNERTRHEANCNKLWAQFDQWDRLAH